MEQGIVHRDLKPANIKVRPDGTVKVLDFGLAKAVGPAEAGHYTPSGVRLQADLANSPTITTPAMTQAGMILGTAAYMAPEQAKGRPVDRRADIWAFGAVLFELLTGTRAFPGEDLTDTLAAVVRAEPDWTLLPADTPAAIRKLLLRCLAKDRTRRLDSAAGARLEIEEALTAPTSVDGTDLPGPGSRIPTSNRGPLLAALAVMAALVAGLAVPAVRHLRETPTPAPPETRLEIAAPATSDLVSWAVSPDGRQIVFVASGDGASRLWVRPLDKTAAQTLAGTDGASFPFWSPDSRSIGFFADGKLKRLDLSGGAPQPLAPAIRGGGGTWSADGVILFAPVTGPLSRVPAGGGDVVPVTTLGAGQNGHLSPQFLPGGRQFLFYATGPAEIAGIYLGALDATAVTRVTAADTAGAYLPSRPGSTDLSAVADAEVEASREGGTRRAEASSEGGWLFFGQQGTLVARRFDPARGALSGDPVTVADALAIDANVGALSVSATGLVTYRAGGAARN